MVYWLNHRPKCPEVAILASFLWGNLNCSFMYILLYTGQHGLCFGYLFSGPLPLRSLKDSPPFRVCFRESLVIRLHSEIDQIHLSIEAQCGTTCLPLGDCHIHEQFAGVIINGCHDRWVFISPEIKIRCYIWPWRSKPGVRMNILWSILNRHKQTWFSIGKYFKMWEENIFVSLSFKGNLQGYNLFLLFLWNMCSLVSYLIIPWGLMYTEKSKCFNKNA